mgnify:CR=1 FL=1
MHPANKRRIMLKQTSSARDRDLFNNQVTAYRTIVFYAFLEHYSYKFSFCLLETAVKADPPCISDCRKYKGESDELAVFQIGENLLRNLSAGRAGQRDVGIYCPDGDDPQPLCQDGGQTGRASARAEALATV